MAYAARIKSFFVRRLALAARLASARFLMCSGDCFLPRPAADCFARVSADLFFPRFFAAVFSMLSGVCPARIAATDLAIASGDLRALRIATCAQHSRGRSKALFAIFAQVSGGRFLPRCVAAIFSITSGVCLLARRAAESLARVSDEGKQPLDPSPPFVRFTKGPNGRRPIAAMSAISYP